MKIYVGDLFENENENHYNDCKWVKLLWLKQNIVRSKDSNATLLSYSPWAAVFT